MGKRGIALVFALLVVMVFSILLAGFFLKSMNENGLVRRHLDSMQAFWAAEAGVAQALMDLPAELTGSTGTLGVPVNKFMYSVTSDWISSRTDPISGELIKIYQIGSTGSVTGTDITRNLQAFVTYTPPSPGGFTAAIEVKNLLKITGSVMISGPPATDPQNIYDATYAKPDSDFSFQGKFDVAPEDVKAYAQAKGHYFEDPNPTLPQYAITNPLSNNMAGDVYWVKITDPKKELQIPKTGWQGDNIILIVEGDCSMEGGDLDGILWVMGKLKISGNPDINGAVISEYETTITSITGNPDIYHDPDAISNAIKIIEDSLGTRAIVAWREQ